MQAVAAEVEATGRIESADYLRNRLDHDIKCCMVDVLKVCSSIPYSFLTSLYNLLCRNIYFRLFQHSLLPYSYISYHILYNSTIDLLFQAANPKFLRKHGYFDLFGFDFMITAANKLVLLEVNTNPAMSLGKFTH